MFSVQEKTYKFVDPDPSYKNVATRSATLHLWFSEKSLYTKQ